MSSAVANGVNGVNGVNGGKSKSKDKNAYRRAKKKAERSGNKVVSSSQQDANNGAHLTDTTQESESREVSVAQTETSTPAPATNGNSSQSAVKQQENDASARSIKNEPNDDVEYEEFDVNSKDPLYSQFAEVFSKFRQTGLQDGDVDVKEEDKGKVFFGDDDNEVPDEEEEAEAERISKKKRKQQSKLSVAELKAVVRRPELVEWTDTSAPDPKLLVSLKGTRNAVPVPSHWSLKREYLSSKRGIEKSHFALPKFIADTGISEMRDAVLEKENEKSLKQKQRDRVQPKMGKLDIDYQKLYEAFFKHQTKPELTRYGEVYYEGKEYETNLRHLRPGELSDDLREALAMPPGAPPPWLINMQRFGPPPSYPSLKIPGLNAPPPPGGTWGFHPGGYGKPPVDDYNRPLYGGDIFGTLATEAPAPEGAPVERSHWGELQQREEEEEEEEEEAEEEEEEEEDEDDKDLPPAYDRGGLASSAPTDVGGAESIGGEFLLRKDGRSGDETPARAMGRQAGTVLEERGIRNQGFFGGERAYDLSKTDRPILGQEYNTGRKRKAQGDVEVSVDVDDLEGRGLSKDEMRRRYDEGRREDGQWKGRVDQDDLSDMIAEEGRKRIKKDREDMEKRRQGRGR
ncbi:Pre-mRNA-splicing factor sap145-like protein [Elsinoe fawcettii]|nr:Pre-mRNA-splicing factor sap145-like protein [Elsinoe fawcettii]